MRDLIKKQLLNLDLAKIEYYDKISHYYVIPKYTGAMYELNKMYLVQVAQPNSYNITFEYLKVYISDISAGRVYIDASACNPITKADLNFYWSGWVKMSDLKQIAIF